MKKSIRVLVVIMSVIVMTQCFGGCRRKAVTSNQFGSSQLSNSETVPGESQKTDTKKQTTLTNHMSEQERSAVTEGPLQLLDEPWKNAGEEETSQEGVSFEIWTRDDILSEMEARPEYYEYLSDSEKNEYLDAMPSQTLLGYMVDGRTYGTMILPVLEGEGYGYYSVLENGQLVMKEIQDEAELRRILPDILKEYEKPEYASYLFTDTPSDVTTKEQDILRVFEAVKKHDYQRIPAGTTSQKFDKYLAKMNEPDLAWELDETAIEKIKDQVTEYHFYDEELDRKFVVHVAVPKGYETNQEALPVLVLTDGVWRFNDSAKLLEEMDAGRAEPQLIISIGQDYAICGADNEERAAVFCTGKDQFLDFITDNLMPYLGEKYKIDYENSTIYGHSLGGVFTHYALFNSDRYENQPFGKYIIGSPAFWSPYSREMSDYAKQATDYGYFDRNTTLNKQVLITAGSDEDEDYAEYFEGGDSTTESIQHLAERINAHSNADSPMAQAKLYKSHHYQYIPEMLVEYVDGEV